MSIVLITVPHARCPDPPVGHECDFAAKPFAEDLHSSLGKRHVRSELRIPNEKEYRRECDLNRYRCRGQEYRKHLTEFMEKNASQIKFVLDIHSFPPPHFDDVDIALLDNKLFGQEGYQQHTKDLERILNQNQLTCKSYVGSSIGHNNNPQKFYTENNDIQDEARLDHNLPCILIEVNERLLKDSNKWEKAVSVISEWVST